MGVCVILFRYSCGLCIRKMLGKKIVSPTLMKTRCNPWWTITCTRNACTFIENVLIPLFKLNVPLRLCLFFFRLLPFVCSIIFIRITITHRQLLSNHLCWGILIYWLHSSTISKLIK